MFIVFGVAHGVFEACSKAARSLLHDKDQRRGRHASGTYHFQRDATTDFKSGAHIGDELMGLSEKLGHPLDFTAALDLCTDHNNGDGRVRRNVVRAESSRGDGASSTPSTRRLLDGVAMPVPCRSTGATAASSSRNDLVKNYRVHPTQHEHEGERMIALIRLQKAMENGI